MRARYKIEPQFQHLGAHETYNLGPQGFVQTQIHVGLSSVVSFARCKLSIAFSFRKPIKHSIT